ncbi:methyltransferase [Caulobacter segnis]
MALNVLALGEGDEADPARARTARRWTSRSATSPIPAPSSGVRGDVRHDAGGPGDLDVVGGNPPFHEGGGEDKTLGQAFIRVGGRRLRKGGGLWIVANRPPAL